MMCLSVSFIQAEQGSGVVAKRLLWATASGSFEKDNTWKDAVSPSQVPFLRSQWNFLSVPITTGLLYLSLREGHLVSAFYTFDFD